MSGVRRIGMKLLLVVAPGRSDHTTGTTPDLALTDDRRVPAATPCSGLPQKKTCRRTGRFGEVQLSTSELVRHAELVRPAPLDVFERAVLGTRVSPVRRVGQVARLQLHAEALELAAFGERVVDL